MSFEAIDILATTKFLLDKEAELEFIPPDFEYTAVHQKLVKGRSTGKKILLVRVDPKIFNIPGEEPQRSTTALIASVKLGEIIVYPINLFEAGKVLVSVCITQDGDDFAVTDWDYCFLESSHRGGFAKLLDLHFGPDWRLA